MSASSQDSHSHAVHRDDTGAKIGMWLFLFTELMLFGGLFVIYAVYRAIYPEAFHHGSLELNVFLGALNTLVLLTSSLTVVLSLAAIQRGDKKSAVNTLTITIALGLVFLVNKYFEWSAKFHHGIYPGSPELEEHGEILFFSLYFMMTGLHGIHVLAGIIALAICLAFMMKGSIHSTDSVKLENVALYWHLVDVVWIFLLPLFYLIS